MTVKNQTSFATGITEDTEQGKPVRILCIGSPFGADRLGWEAARLLEKHLDPGLATVSAHDRPGMQLLALMRGAAAVILVDAVKSGAAPGTLHRLEGTALRTALARHTSTHGFGLAEALALADQIGELPPQLVLWGVEIRTAGIKPADLTALAEAVAGEARACASAANAPSAKT